MTPSFRAQQLRRHPSRSSHASPPDLSLASLCKALEVARLTGNTAPLQQLLRVTPELTSPVVAWPAGSKPAAPDGTQESRSAKGGKAQQRPALEPFPFSQAALVVGSLRSSESGSSPSLAPATPMPAILRPAKALSSTTPATPPQPDAAEDAAAAAALHTAVAPPLGRAQAQRGEALMTQLLAAGATPARSAQPAPPLLPPAAESSPAAPGAINMLPWRVSSAVAQTVLQQQQPPQGCCTEEITDPMMSSSPSDWSPPRLAATTVSPWSAASSSTRDSWGEDSAASPTKHSLASCESSRQESSSDEDSVQSGYSWRSAATPIAAKLAGGGHPATATLVSGANRKVALLDDLKGQRGLSGAMDQQLSRSIAGFTDDRDDLAAAGDGNAGVLLARTCDGKRCSGPGALKQPWLTMDTEMERQWSASSCSVM